MKSAYIVVFNSVANSTQLFRILKNSGFDISIISTPCTISAGCSRAIEFKEDDLDKIIQIAIENPTGIQGIYKRVLDKRRFYYTRVKV